MKRKPLISIVITTKNEEANIERCLKSIKSQKYKGKIEIIVVDNFSTDQTVILARKYTDLIFQTGPERSAQRNFGAKKANGRLLLFLDADMQLSPNVIRECVGLARGKGPKTIVAISEIGRGYNFWGKALSLEKNCYFQGPTWIIAARFFPRSLFLRFKGYDTHLHAGEDWDLTQRIEEAGFLMLLTRSYLIHHEQKVSLFTLLKKEAYYIENIGEYAKRHPLAFSYQGSLLYRSLIWARSWRDLIAKPLYALGFLTYKLTVWLMWQVKSRIS